MTKESLAGRSISEPFLIEQFSSSTGKNGLYYSLVLRGKSGSFDARWWSPNASFPPSRLKPGKVIEVLGAYNEYQGKMQINIHSMNESSKDAKDFARSSKFNVDTMWADVESQIASLKEPLTKYVTEEILTKHEIVSNAVKKAPAAKAVHNNWYGGLLEHIHSMLSIASKVIPHYKQRHPQLSKDKIIFGIIVHDLAKIVEYDVENPAFPITEVGVLTNHIVIAPAWIHSACNRYPDKGKLKNFTLERAQLMHLVAAHHGSKDWGSPVPPSTLEAIIVHHLDNLDSKFMHALDLIEQGADENPLLTKTSYYEKTRYLIPQGDPNEPNEEDESNGESGEATNVVTNEGSPDSIDDGVRRCYPSDFESRAPICPDGMLYTS